MSETTTHVHAPHKSAPAPTIVRNEISKVLTKGVFGKKSPAAGTEFWFPTFTEANITDDLKWFGIDNVIGGLNKVSRAIFSAIFEDHFTDEDGSFLPEKFTDKAEYEAYLADLADFTAGVDSKSDLEIELNRLVDEQGLYFDVASDEKSTDEQTEEAQRKMLEIAAQLKPIRRKIKEIEAKYAVRTAQRAAKKALKEKNSPTKTPAPQTEGVAA